MCERSAALSRRDRWGFLRDAEWLTPERLLRWGCFSALVSIGAAAGCAALFTVAGLTTHLPLGGDFIDFWSGARLAAAGQARLAYDPHFFNAFVRSIFGPLSEATLYSYPPVAMLLWWPLSLLSYPTALALWSIGGIAVCGWLLALVAGWRAAVLASFGAPAAVIDIIQGQNGHFTAALFAAGLMLLDRNQVFAGVVLGALCFKPQLGIVLPIALLAGGYWRAFFAAAGTVVALVAVSAILFGPESWAAFLGHQLAVQRRIMEAGITWWHGTPTVFAAMRLLGVPVTGAYIAQGASALLAMAAVAVVWRARCSAAIKACALVVGAFLATPYSWEYDLVIMSFAAAWLAKKGIAHGFLPWEKIICLALVGLPVAFVPGPAPIVLWLAMLVIVRRGLFHAEPAAPEPSAVPDTPV